MEHFYIPIGMLIVGRVLSAFILPVEILIHRKTVAKQEEPRVSQV